MMRMLGPGLPGGLGGGARGWEVVALPIFWLAGGWGPVRPFSVLLAWVGLEVVALGGRGVGRKGAWPAGPDPSAGALLAFAWSLSHGFA